MNHKDVAKSTAFLHGVFINLRTKLEYVLEQFYKFSDIWNLDKDKECSELASQNPSLSEWRARITKFDEKEQEIRKLPKVGHAVTDMSNPIFGFFFFVCQ